MAAATARFRGDTSHLNRAIRGAGRNIKSMSSEATRSFGRVGGAVNALMSPLGLVAGAVAGIGRSLTFLSEVDKQARMTTNLIANAGAADLDRVREAAATVATEYNIGNQAALAGLYEALSAGAANIDAATDVMRTAAMASVSAGVDMNEAAKFYQQQSAIWGKTAIEIADLTAATERSGVVTTAQLVQNFGRISTQAKLAGVEVEQSLGQLAQLTKAGIVPTEAVTMLGRLYQEVVNPEAKLYKAIIEATGKEWQELVAEGHTLSDVLTDVQRHTGDMFLTVFGRETGARAAQIILDDAEGLAATIDTVANSQGELQRNFDRATEGISFSIAAMKQAWEDLKISLGEAVAPALVPAFRDLADSFTELAKDPEFAQGLSKLATGLAENVPKLVELGPHLLALADNIAELTASLARLVGLVPAGVTSDVLLAAMLYRTWPAAAAGAGRAVPFAAGGAAAGAGAAGAMSTRTAAATAMAASKGSAAIGVKAGSTLAANIGKGLIRGASRWALPVLIGNELIKGITGVDFVGAFASWFTEPLDRRLTPGEPPGSEQTLRGGPAGRMHARPAPAPLNMAGLAGAPPTPTRPAGITARTPQGNEAYEAELAAHRALIDDLIEQDMRGRRAMYEGAQEYWRLTAQVSNDAMRVAAKAQHDYWTTFEAQMEAAWGPPPAPVAPPSGLMNVELFDALTQAKESQRLSVRGELIGLGGELRNDGSIAQNLELNERIKQMNEDGVQTIDELRNIVEWLRKIFEVEEETLDALDTIAEPEMQAAVYYAPVSIRQVEGVAL